MTGANLTAAECAERGAALDALSYRVQLDLTEARTTDWFRSETTIRFSSTIATSWVDLIAEELISATLNGDQLDPASYDGTRLPLPNLHSDNELHVVARCAYSTSGDGLHRFVDPADGETYLYTHFEPTEARRVFACFEQPDLKSRFTFQVTAPSSWTVLSGQAEAARLQGDETCTVTFAPTPLLSTYITALAAGPYAAHRDEWRSTDTGQVIPLGVFARRSMAEFIDFADIFAVTKQGLDFLNREFGFAYPWGKYDQIFVPEYNIGAMENPGLVTFTESYLSRGGQTAAQRNSRSDTVLHEMAHMWFGDLVTMRWWDDLWLKESFAEVMGYLVTDEATEYTGSWIAFSSRKNWAYGADLAPSTHPVVAQIRDLEEAGANFDGITYAKGAAALRQLMAYVGRDAFFAGARTYFERHAFGSATMQDLLDALEAASGRDLSSWSQVWLRTAGPCTVSADVDTAADGTVRRLTVHKTATDPITGAQVNRPHQLQVGLYAVGPQGLTQTALIPALIDAESTELSAAAGHRADLVVVNDGDLTYALVDLSDDSLAVMAEHLSTLPDALTRSVLWSNAWMMVVTNRLAPSRFLRLVEQQLPRESRDDIVLAVSRMAAQCLSEWLAPALREEWSNRCGTALLSGLAAAAPHTDNQRNWVHAVSTVCQPTAQVRELLWESDKFDVDLSADQRWRLAIGLRAHSAVSDDELNQLLTHDDTMSGHTAYVEAVASTPTTAAKDTAWQRLSTGEVTNDSQRALIAGYCRGVVDRDAHAGQYFDSLATWWSTMNLSLAGRLVTGLFPETSARVDAPGAAQRWLEKNPSAPAVLRRRVDDERERSVRMHRAHDLG